MNDETLRTIREAKHEGANAPELLPSVSGYWQPRDKYHAILFELDEKALSIKAEISQIDEAINELTITGWCGNISICRHSNDYGSNNKQIIKISHKGEEKFIIDYVIDKLNKRKTQLLNDELQYKEFFKNVEELYAASFR